MTFSVLITIYKNDSASHLQDALTSIWESQVSKPNEIVLVKDGIVTNELEAVVNQWKATLGNVLNIIALKENRGLGNALNVGLAACKFDLVARMDADDIAFPDRFEKQVAFLEENSNVDVLGSYVKEMTVQGEIGEVRLSPVTHKQIIECLWASPMVHPSVIMRRSRIIEVGNYDPSLRRRQDYELWFRCVEGGLKFYNLPEPLLYYRFGKNTHKKQPPNLAWQQALIGYRGSTRLELPISQRIACFIPFFRSLLPSSMQHVVFRLLKPLDPRRKV